MPHNLTSHVQTDGSSEKPQQSKAERSCIANGGKWDPEAQNCIFPESETGSNTSKQSVETPAGNFLGLNRTDIELLQQQQAPQGTPGGQGVPISNVAPLGTAQQQQTQARAREDLLINTGVLDQTSPEFEQIDIASTKTVEHGPLRPDEDTPVIGPGIGAIRALRQSQAKEKSELNGLIAEQGLSAAEEFGVYVEAIPILGGLADKFVRGLNTPTDNIRDIRTNINGLREAAEFQATQAREGKVDPQTALNTIIEMQDRVIEMETRLKYLIQFSTVLRSSSDDVDTIEVEIFRTKQKLFIAGQTAAAGAIAEPDPLDISITLQELKERRGL